MITKSTSQIVPTCQPKKTDCTWDHSPTVLTLYEKRRSTTLNPTVAITAQETVTQRDTLNENRQISGLVRSFGPLRT